MGRLSAGNLERTHADFAVLEPLEVPMAAVEGAVKRRNFPYLWAPGAGPGCVA